MGDRLLVRLYERGSGRYHAHLMRLLPRLARETVGVLEAGDDGIRLRPSERSAKVEFSHQPR